MTDEELTLTEFAARLGASRNTVARWPRQGMPVLPRGTRGHDKTIRVSLRRACFWLIERDAFVQRSDWTLIKTLELQRRADAILQGLNRAK